jgi:hypothetical protein
MNTTVWTEGLDSKSKIPVPIPQSVQPGFTIAEARIVLAALEGARRGTHHGFLSTAILRFEQAIEWAEETNAKRRRFLIAKAREGLTNEEAEEMLALIELQEEVG